MPREDRWLLGLGAAAAVCAAILSAAGHPAFARFLGPLPPVPVTIAAALLALAVQRLLRRAGWLARPLRPVPLARLALVGTCLAALTIATDIAAPYPAAINVALPGALLFYPAIGLVAEVAFHLLPLALVLVPAGALRLPRRPALIAAACLAAAVEPAFQIAAGWGGGPTWRDAVLAATLFALGLAQVAALLRHGFAAMLWLRLVYYLHWHILWGAARLELLF